MFLLCLKLMYFFHVFIITSHTDQLFRLSAHIQRVLAFGKLTYALAFRCGFPDGVYYLLIVYCILIVGGIFDHCLWAVMAMSYSRQLFLFVL